MPPRSKVLQLPEDVRQQLDRRLVSGGFQDYDGLAAWLAEQGFEISASSVHRYGQAFEKRLAALTVATQQARAVAEATHDDEGRLGEALTSLVQQKAFEVLVEMEDVEGVGLVQLGTMVAKLNRTAVSQKRFILEVREKAAATAEEVERMARRGGLSDEAAAAIRQKILGIAT